MDSFEEELPEIPEKFKDFLTGLSFGDEPAEIVLYSGKDSFKVSSFPPYFYFLGKKEPEKIEGAIRIKEEKKVRPPKGLPEGRRLFRIFADSPGRVPEIRGKFSGGTVFEADIPFVRRFLLDNSLKFFSERDPSFLIFDIEVYSESSGMPDAKKDEIVMISYSFFKEGAFVEERVLSAVQGRMEGPLPEYASEFPSEKALIVEFVSVLRRLDPHIIAGYNSDNFDFPYLSARAEILKVPLLLGTAENSRLSFKKRQRISAGIPEIPGRQVVDVYLFVRYIVSHDPSFHARTLDLDSVGTEIFGEGKTDFDFEELPEIMRTGKGVLNFIEYSLRDAKVTARLFEKFLPLMLELSRALYLPPSEISRMTSGQIVEWFLVKEAHERGILVPNRPSSEASQERDEQRFEGAFVRDPERGLHENVAACDFRSLYPSIIISHNIAPETFGKCDHPECAGNISPTGDPFCQKDPGLIPASLRKIVSERAILKKEMKKAASGSPERISINAKQAALKLVANSFYGYLGYQNSRWYSFEGARSTAGWGRKYIKDTISLAERRDFRVIYGDTDSLFFSYVGKDISLESLEGRVKKFVSEINGALPEEMELELQDIYSRGIFLTKKRYAVITTDGRIVIKGLERIRRDWAGIARRTQEDVLMAILKEGNPEKARGIVEKAVSDLKARKVSIDDITIYTQLTKKPGQYKLTSPHVEAAKLSKKPMKAGTVVRFGIVRGTGMISARARPLELLTLENYDPDYYIDNQLLPAVTRILDAVGYSEDAFKSQKKLEGFF